MASRLANLGSCKSTPKDLQQQLLVSAQSINFTSFQPGQDASGAADDDADSDDSDDDDDDDDLLDDDDDDNI